MNIIAVIQRYYPAIGGSENLAKEFLDHLSNKHKITVMTTNANEIQSFWYKDKSKIQNEDNYKYEIKRFDFEIPTQIGYESNEKLPIMHNYPGPFSSQLWNELIVKKPNADLIYTTSFPHNHIIPAFIASKKYRIPLIIMPLIHQKFPELYMSAIPMTILKNCDAVFVLTKSEKNILEKFGLDSEKISIIKPVLQINNNLIKTYKKNNKTKKRIVFVGSKSESKGVFYLIDSMKKILVKRKDVELIIIGPQTNEFKQYFDKLPQKIKVKIIDKGVINENEKYQNIAACNVLVVPSKSESFGLVYLEAWMFSKPVIGCNLLPVSEIIENGKDGLLVNFGNKEELQSSITYLLDNPEICDKLGKNGYKKVQQYRTEESFVLFERKCEEVIQQFNR